jgi:putative ABC transport system substrate-binding protein
MFTTALQRLTRTIPIVFVGVADPIGSGFIASLARPGGNLTGFMLYEASVAGKWLAMLKEIAPSLARSCLMYEPGVTVFYLHAAEALAPSLAIELVPSPVGNAADIEHAIESCARIPNSGLIVAPNLTTQSHRDLVITLTARYRLPTVYSYRAFVSEGGLMSYHTDYVEMGHATSIAPCAAPSPPICLCRRRQGTRQCSTSRLPRRSALMCRHPSLCAPTR